MSKTDVQPSSIEGIKRLAKAISKRDAISHTKALDSASQASGFGNFQLRDKPQRPGRNPKTGEDIPITARRVVTFHPSQKLKSMVEINYHGKPQA